MLPGLVGVVLLVGVVVGPLLWRVWDDRRKENALRVRAELHMVLFRALQGDSFVSVDALPPTLWRPGRVVLSAPSDWQSVLQTAWRAVADQVPAGWEVVIRSTQPVVTPAPVRELRRAA
jgi:hypothetical protein